jgi:hypothetical protein
MSSLLIILTLLALYLIPSIIACRRKHNNAVPIILLNAVLGWTLIGWFAALIWATTCNVRGRYKRGSIIDIQCD